MKLKSIKVLSIVLGASTLLSAQEVLTNDAAYDQNLPKKAIYKSASNENATAFRIVALPSLTIALQGVPNQSVNVAEWSGQPNFSEIDFSAVTQAGTYRIDVDAGSQTYMSSPFEIGPSALINKTLPSLMSYFYESRADESAVWSADVSVRKLGASTNHDVRGGWYDASGDISKYLSHLSYANYYNPQQIPMIVWVMADLSENLGQYLSAVAYKDKVDSEALWGADYLVRILDEAGYFYTNVFDGWTGKMEDRRICAFEGSDGVKTTEFQAAFREGAGVSIASLARISQWPINGVFSGVDYLAAAEKAYAHLKIYNANYDDDGVENIIDDYTALLAASELYLATKNADYLADARIRASNMKAKQDAAGFFWANSAKTRPYYHAAEAGLPLVALTRYAEVELDAVQKSSAIEMIKLNFSYQIAVSKDVENPFGYARQTINYNSTIKNSFFIPKTNETGYWWQGESARLASLSAAVARSAMVVYKGEVPQELKEFATSQLDWIMGKNPFNVSMFSGIGDNNPPAYNNDSKMPIHGHLNGGISNGITAANNNGSGIAWNPANILVQGWENWRWVEQWLPHSTWFLMAVGSWEAIKEQSVPTKSINHANRVIKGDYQQGLLKINSEIDQEFKIYNAKGVLKKSWSVNKGDSYLKIELPKGIWFLKGKDQSLKLMVN